MTMVGREFLTIKGIQVWYDPANLIVHKGEIDVFHREVVGIIGRNGSGKTTLMNSICGIHDKYEFSDFLFDRVKSGPSDPAFRMNRYICFSADDSFRYWNMDKLVNYLLLSFGEQRDESYLNWLIEGFRIAELRQKRLSSLSSGQRKKVMLTAAFCIKRTLLLLDEPIDFLDFDSTEFLYKAINDYKHRVGSIVMCSHIMESFVRCCSRIFVIDFGKVTGPYDVSQIKAMFNSGEDFS